MANSVNIPSDLTQIQNNYNKYKDYFVDDENDTLGQDAFLTLMVEQMKNQDFMSPTDNSEYIAQMAQFSMVQEMQQMNYNTNASYATSLIGKTVTTSMVDVASTSVAKSTGVVTGVKMNGTSFEIIVNGNSYDLKDITEVLLEAPKTEAIKETENDTVVTETASASNANADEEEESNEEVLRTPEVPDISLF